MAVRLSTSVMVGAYSISKEPENEYLKLHAIPARSCLRQWSSIPWSTHAEFFTSLQNEYLQRQSHEIDMSVWLSMITTLKDQFYVNKY